MKKLSIQFILFISLPVFTQTTSPDVLLSSGKVIESEEGSVSWTIGEILIETVSESDFNLLQGYQEVEDMPFAIEEIDLGDYWISVFPTLTESMVNVVFTEEYNLLSKGYLLDISGQICGIYDFNSTINELDLTDFHNGMYLLTIINEKDKPVKEIKIIKL